jgi:hypothetical protein
VNSKEIILSPLVESRVGHWGVLGSMSVILPNEPFKEWTNEWAPR